MSTFPSIRQNLRLIEWGLWHTLSDTRHTAIRQVEKAHEQRDFRCIASVFQLYEDPFLGAKRESETAPPLRGRLHRRRRAMAKTYVILAFGLGLAACNTPPQAAPSVAGEACRVDDPAWTTCMQARKRGRHPPAELLFTDWRD